jgi:hypothetical protein
MYNPIVVGRAAKGYQIGQPIEDDHAIAWRTDQEIVDVHEPGRSRLLHHPDRTLQRIGRGIDR